MGYIAGKWHALSDYRDPTTGHRPVARSNRLLWPTPQAGIELERVMQQLDRSDLCARWRRLLEEQEEEQEEECARLQQHWLLETEHAAKRHQE